MRASHIFAVLFGGLAAAFPFVAIKRAGEVDAQSAIEAIMPTSNTCSGAQFPDECRTAAQAASYIITSLTGYSYGQIAAMLALMGYESADMKYKHNVFPGTPGQGTANMMMPNFVAGYAESIKPGSTADKTPAEILAMVTPDEHNFGSAAWYIKTTCPGVMDGLTTGSNDSWNAYMECISVSGTDEGRLAYWNRAKSVFGL
ncbi:hypothetical protein B0T17DRAFT_619176 [Bombardia bombarda]|uniref:Uncharacterized protein n=1 Tax=Bombardia bombarda TaxID=252184 RepID=A0AA40BYY0_9PEZI|nr:hypothetical protein B0T17DRAFT_619176 [Bombardia bombarda]